MTVRNLLVVIAVAVAGCSSAPDPSGEDDGPPDLPPTCPCPLESYCDLGTNSCVLGCLADPDCEPGRYCELDSRTCVDGCRDDSECGAGTICDDHQCVAGCRGDGDCMPGYDCDANECVDACLGMSCTNAPPPECHGSAKRTYDEPGTCAVGACSYPFVDTPCPGGCSGGHCNPGWFPLPATGAPSGRFNHAAVWTGTEMIVWGGGNSSHNQLGDGGRFDPTTGTWAAVPTAGAPLARIGHTAVWTGTEMIVWGGQNYDVASSQQMRNDGGRFNPATGAWTPMSTTGAPIGRAGHVAVWTGTEMIIWGGNAFVGALGDGGRYNPATNSWSPLATTGAPSARTMHTAAWSGTQMIVWGGWDVSAYLASGGRFNPATGAWTSLPAAGAPSARRSTAAVWTGPALAPATMIVWGGEGPGGFADLRADGGTFNGTSWGALPVAGAPTAREGHTAVWTGTEMIVWGGFAAAGYQATGGRYVPPGS